MDRQADWEMGTRTGERIKGKVRWYNPKKGYGFVTPKHGKSEDIFVHFSDIVKNERNPSGELREDDRVIFELVVSGGKRKAIEVEFLKEKKPKHGRGSEKRGSEGRGSEGRGEKRSREGTDLTDETERLRPAPPSPSAEKYHSVSDPPSAHPHRRSESPRNAQPRERDGRHSERERRSDRRPVRGQDLPPDSPPLAPSPPDTTRHHSTDRRSAEEGHQSPSRDHGAVEQGESDTDRDCPSPSRYERVDIDYGLEEPSEMPDTAENDSDTMAKPVPASHDSGAEKGDEVRKPVKMSLKLSTNTVLRLSVADASKKVSERAELFELKCSPTNLPSYEASHPDLGFVDASDISHVLDSEACPKRLVQKLQKQLERREAVVHEGKASLLATAQANLFPEGPPPPCLMLPSDTPRSLAEIVERLDVLDMPGSFVFVDLASGDSTVASALLQTRLDSNPALKCVHGYGLSRLQVAKWSTDIQSRPNFTIVHGDDGSGDLYSLRHVQHLAELIAANGHGHLVSLCYGSSVFEGSEKGLDTVNELAASRVLVSQVLAMMNTLVHGGNFILKIGTAFSDFTISIAFILTRMFEKCVIFKPKASRIVSSERYIVGKGFRRNCDDFARFSELLQTMHWLFKQHNPGNPYALVPKALVPKKIVKLDQAYLSSISLMVQTLAQKQRHALQLVLDLAEKLAPSDPV